MRDGLSTVEKTLACVKPSNGQFVLRQPVQYGELTTAPWFAAGECALEKAAGSIQIAKG